MNMKPSSSSSQCQSFTLFNFNHRHKPSSSSYTSSCSSSKFHSCYGPHLFSLNNSRRFLTLRSSKPSFVSHLNQQQQQHSLLDDSHHNHHEDAEATPQLSSVNQTQNQNQNEKQGYFKSISDVKREIILLTLPALAGQAIDPMAQLMETAYIGRLDMANISASDQGGSIEITGNGNPFKAVYQRNQLSSVSTALLLALGLGLFEAFALYFGSVTFLRLIGVSPGNPTLVPAQKFLSLRAFGAPAVVLSLALQGIFRGFKDTKTPFICLGIGNLSAVFLFPLLMYYFKLGVAGAAISTVLSQYIGTLLMIWCLNKRAVLLPPKMGNLQFGGYIKSGGFLLGRTLAVLTTMTLGTSMATRHGPVAMAAHQICMQVWLAFSLLTDALAASGQALIASSLSRHEYKAVKEITHFVLKIGLLTGICLTAILGVSFGSLATLFTQDLEVLQVVRTGVLFVSASQPFNALAYVFDGLHYGVSDFPYAALSMMFVGAVSSAFLVYAPSHFGLQGVWLGLTLFMALRVVAGSVRLLSKNGPWWFLHKDFQIAEMVS
ncbi:unnamed protein product [Trifolium pratense]|uniref:Uncharacterized protein n=1 Tax=Trifolium pratense TaxID=57577 RepID=A0ACB0IMA0_TRIPR|nr:unnamed protein product [Trifolium pratense]